jgi:uncharacterized protein (TIGR03118 family)
VLDRFKRAARLLPRQESSEQAKSYAGWAERDPSEAERRIYDRRMAQTRLASKAGIGRVTKRLVVAAIAALAVAACDGGGSGNDGPSTPEVSLTASPTSLTLGQTTTLTWAASEGASCTATGAWSGAKPPDGSETVTPVTTGSVTYTLTCGGASFSGDATASATVTVEAPSAYSPTALVADTAGTTALTADANVANAWGLALGPTTPLWVANRRNHTSTIYDGNGKRQPLASPLVVRLPPRALNVPFGPTGIVFNATDQFVVSRIGVSGTARFIYAGESGALAGWSSAVDVDDAAIAYVATDGAQYTGLAIGATATGPVLYAADFANRKIDVFDGTFAKQPTSSTTFAFADPELPANFAPFGIQAFANGPGGATQVYVSYALRDPDFGAVVPGEGLGLVNVYDANGALLARLVPDGAQLDAPWGMALAPDDFGSLGGSLLVGNFGDGRIHGFDPATGELVGIVANVVREPFALPGLRGLAFGNDAHNLPHSTLFYAAGTNNGVNGAIGRIDLGDTPPVLNEPPVVAITSPAAGTVSGTVTIAASVTAGTNVASVEFLADTTVLGIVGGPPYSIPWDTTTRPNGTVSLTARATDTSGNVGISPPVTVTVSN